MSSFTTLKNGDSSYSLQYRIFSFKFSLITRLSNTSWLLSNLLVIKFVEPSISLSSISRSLIVPKYRTSRQICWRDNKRKTRSLELSWILILIRRCLSPRTSLTKSNRIATFFLSKKIFVLFRRSLRKLIERVLSLTRFDKYYKNKKHSKESYVIIN